MAGADGGRDQGRPRRPAHRRRAVRLRAPGPRTGPRARPGRAGLARLLRGRLPRCRRCHLVPARHWLAVVRPGHRGYRRGHVRDDRNGTGPRPADAARRAAGGVDRGDSARRRPGPRPGRPVRAVPRRAGDHDRRWQALRERLAGHRRSSVGANRPGARRSGRVLLGVHAVRLLVLGAPRRAGRLPGGRTHLDGPQPDRARLPGGRRGYRGPPGRALAGPAALRGQARHRGLRHDGRLPRRGLRLAGRPDGAAGSPFRPGAIDVAGLAVMALALAVARQALRQARAGAR